MREVKDRTIEISEDTDAEGKPVYVCMFGWDHEYKLGGAWCTMAATPKEALMQAIENMDLPYVNYWGQP